MYSYTAIAMYYAYNYMILTHEYQPTIDESIHTITLVAFFTRNEDYLEDKISRYLDLGTSGGDGFSK